VTRRNLLLLGVPAACLLIGGIVGVAATGPVADSVLINGAPCTVTMGGASYDGNCSGGFVQALATSPSPTPTSTPTPTATPTATPTPAPSPTVAPASGVTLFYASTSFWNQPIGSNPTIDPNSAAIVQAALISAAGGANFANTAAWGRAMVYSHNSDPVYTVGCVLYDCGTTITFNIPVGAKPETGSDGHLVVINQDTGQELDMWQAVFANGSWSAGSRYLTDSQGWGAICALGQHCGGAVAAGFAAFGGVVRPEEIQQGHIDHALVLTAALTRSGYIACPATHTDGVSPDPGAIPEGAHIQLDPAFNVDAQAWPQWEKVTAHALQTYGAYVLDTGGSIAMFGESNLNGGLAWSSLGVPNGPSLSSLPWGSFRVLQLTAC
jgi:hypothetical protein